MTHQQSPSPVMLFPTLVGTPIEHDVTRFLTNIGVLDVHYDLHLQRFGNFFDPANLGSMTDAQADALIAAGEAFREGVRGEIAILPYHVRLCAGDGRVPSTLFDLVLHQDTEGVAISATTVQLLFLTHRLGSCDWTQPIESEPQIDVAGSLDRFGVFVLNA